MLESRIDDCWNIKGDRDFSDSWTGFPRFTILDEKPPDGYTWSGERLEANNMQAGLLVAGDMEKTCQVQLNEKKHKSGLSRNRSWTIARRWRGIYFIDPADAEFKESIQKCAEKVGSSDAMPCKIRGRKYKETCRTLDARKTEYTCIVEADESTRKRFEGTLQKDHIPGKGINSLNHYNLAHKFIPMPKAMRIPDAKAAVDK